MGPFLEQIRQQIEDCGNDIRMLPNLHHARIQGASAFLPSLAHRLWDSKTFPCPYRNRLYKEAWYRGLYSVAAWYWQNVEKDEVVGRKHYEPKSAHNPRPSLATVIREIDAVCRRTAGDDGTMTTSVKIWVVRRAMEYLLELQENQEQPSTEETD